jgi:hypothetical protein
MRYSSKASADALFDTLIKQSFTNPKGNKTMTTNTNQTEGFNTLVRNVQLYWAKLDKPVDPFGTLQWELTIQVPKKREAEIASFGKVKEGFEKNTVAVALKKKALKADGTEAAKVNVVDANKQPFDSKLIGNGSTGNIIVFQRPYEIKAPNGKVTKSGTSTMLTKVQVTELVKYERKSGDFVDFEEEEGNTNSKSDTYNNDF